MIVGTFLQGANFIDVLYIVAFGLFIYGLSGLTGPSTAVRGNRIAAVGMAVAVIATLLNPDAGNWGLIVLGVAIGTAVGIPAARRVKMTAMPQMVALFNGVGGGAVALVAWAEFRNTGGYAHAAVSRLAHPGTQLPIAAGSVPLYFAAFSLFAAIVGSVSFWGSNIAFAKLQGLLPGKPITLGPVQQLINGGLFAAAVALAVVIAAGSHSELIFVLILVIAGVLGNFVVLPIGGADMPVVISLLNAFTGLSAAATGVALNNPALIVAGMIVGASGTILTNLMAEAMNRSIPGIVAGGFGGGGAVEGASGAGEHAGTVRSTTAADVAVQLAYARLVVVVPGYGMAVAQAQHAVRELAKELEKRGVEVKYAIHPVAGRMPGHMNVLLAEADVPYEQLREMDDINPEFSRTDVALVIGANDVTNPAAKSNASSPIFGMPILEVSDSHSVIVIKRSMNPGFAGVENELYYDPKTSMLFADAKAGVSEITAELSQL
ncbi:MAG: H+-translocating transhydrogenase subunit beta [Solirubrobacteraceae bacterium]|jgi:NAD(P) transhydrogenase subunit beta|nr:H+-translocating transhydrogenase subunit beta [Solirubrobacteraceae bacterium]